jgi:hypothetical protein
MLRARWEIRCDPTHDAPKCWDREIHMGGPGPILIAALDTSKWLYECQKQHSNPLLLMDVASNFADGGPAEYHDS